MIKFWTPVLGSRENMGAKTMFFPVWKKIFLNDKNLKAKLRLGSKNV